MAKIYTPTKEYFADNRIQKLCQDLVRDAKIDRQYLLEARDLFKEMIETNPADAVAKTQLVNVLKLLQTSHTKTKEAIEVVIRFEALKAKLAQAKGTGKDVPENSDLFAYLKKLDSNES